LDTDPASIPGGGQPAEPPTKVQSRILL